MLVYKRNPYWHNAFTGHDYPMGSGLRESNCRKPATNISEKDDAFMLHMALPGYSRKDIAIDINKNILKVSSQVESQTAENETILKREFRSLPFERQFELPDMVDTDKIKAEFKNGVLKVVIPKMEHAIPKPAREIEIS